MYLETNTNDKERELRINKQISHDQEQIVKHYEHEISEVIRSK